MQIRQALNWAQTQIGRSDANFLLEELLNVSAAWVRAHDDEAFPKEHLAQFKEMVQQAADDVPIPYLLGHAWFYGRKFSVSPAVLIPRPETEELVQKGLAFLRGKTKQSIIDVGTGSGIIALTLALETQEDAHHILATDVSAEALAIAKENRDTLQANATFAQDDLLTNQHGPFDLIIANLPYIGETEKNVMGVSVLKHEPHLALFSPNDGFSHIETLLAQAQSRLATNGAILLEIGYAQGEKGLSLCKHYFPQANCSLLKDLAGQDRILSVKSK